MSEELSYQLYKWLSSLDIVPATLRYKSNGNYELDHKTAQGLLNGSLLSKLLIDLAKEHQVGLNLPLLASIKNSGTPAARMYNWNILQESFMKINVSIPKETIKEITTGNFASLLRFLLELHKKFNLKKPQRREEKGQGQLNLKKLQVLQSYDEAQNLLQLIVMIISDSLGLTPKQTLSTLSDNAKYYAHMVVKGVKGSFTQIETLLETFLKELKRIMDFCQKSPQANTQFLLELIKPTLISRQSDIARKGAQLFEKFLEESLRYNSKNLVYQILTKQNVGFDFLYMALKRHPDLIHDFNPFIFPLVSHAMPDFFQVHLKRTINNPQQYLKITLILLQGLSADPESKKALRQSGLLEMWLKNCQASFGNKVSRDEGSTNEETKLLYLELLCNLWKDYAEEIDQQLAEQMLGKGIYQLKKNTRKDIHTIKIPALLRLFDFLHFLADSKNKMASLLYKQIIFLFIQNHENTEIRELILNNFIIILRDYPSIPVQFLLEPLLKQLQVSQGKSYVLNIFDFQFLVELCKHPKMDASNALSYLKYLTKLYIKSYIYAKLTARVIKILTSRFCEEETIIEFLKKTIDNTLNQYGVLTFNKKKATKEDTIVNKQKQSLAIQLIKHFIQLEHQQLRDFIRGRVTGLYLLWLQTKNHTNKGLKYLIELYGDVDQICLQHKIKQNQAMQQIQSPSRRTQGRQESQFEVYKPTPKSQAYYEMEYMKQKGIGYKEGRKHNKTHNYESQLQPSTMKPAPKVLEDLQKIREKVNKKRQDQDFELRKLRQKKNVNSLQLMQRNLSLGYAKITPQNDQQVLFEFDSVKQKQLKNTIKFYTPEQLQDADKQSVKTVLKLHAKDIKSLFLRYALISNADNIRREESIGVISFTSAVKMINEKGLNINKLVMSDLIASINSSKRKEKNILFGIEQTDFNEFLTKLTDYLIQTEISPVQVPFGLRLQELLKTLFTGQNFYDHRKRKEDPKIQRVKEALNDGDESQFLIPDGYKKVKETQVDLKYEIVSEGSGVDQLYKVGYQLADWLLHQCLGFHIISPIVQIKPKYNLIQIPKSVTLGFPKQGTQPNIKNEIQGRQSKRDSPDRSSDKSRKLIKNELRSQSTRAMHHNSKKTLQVQSQEEKLKEAKKRQKYAQKLKENLQKLRVQRAQKEEQKRKEKQQKAQREKKKELQRKKYLQQNKDKLKHYREKQNEQEKEKLEEQKRKQQKMHEDQKKRERQMFQKRKDDIRKYAEKVIEKNKGHQDSKDKTLKKSQTKVKQPVVNEKEQGDKARMTAVKQSLDNGPLKAIVNQYDKQLNELFQAYWAWDKKRIDLNSMALMLKDFEISPEYITPKVLADTFKPISRGQPLDFASFVECLVKCGYRSSLVKEGEHSVSENVLKQFFQLFKMKEHNYKEVLRQTKNHIK